MIFPFRVEKLMKLRTSFGAALAIVATSLSSAQAVVLFQDTFDTYTSQAEFEAVWTPVGCSLSGLPTNCGGGMQSNTLSQDFQGLGRGNTLFNSSPPTPAPATISDADRNQIILPQDTPILGIGDKLVFSFDFFDFDSWLDGPLASPYRQYVTLQYRNPSGTFETNTNQLIGLGMNNNQSGANSGGQFYMARILGYDPRNAPAPSTPPADPEGGPEETVGGSGAFFKLNDFATGTGAGPGSRPNLDGDLVNNWHNLKVEISTSDGVSQDYAFYVDNQLAELVNNVGTALRQYNTIRIGSGLSSPIDAYYDNFKIEYIQFVPPPSDNADFNKDGVIDAADYVVWRKFSGTTGGATHEMGDANGDGNVNATDEQIWTQTFGNMITGAGGGLGGNAVPEPASGVLLLVGVSALALRRRSR